MKLYKFVPTLALAEQFSIGIFRFYELIKYIELEEDSERPDAMEGSLCFPEDGSPDYCDKLPTASLNGIEFQYGSIKLSNDYLRQYFVFCTSTSKNEAAIGDCPFAVELDTDYFETLAMFLDLSRESRDHRGHRFFSHGKVEYYDIDNHPLSIEGQMWREVYQKHSNFEHQAEYRAAFFASDFFFNRISKKPMVIERPIYNNDERLMHFNLKFKVSSGIDDNGWRFIEIDITEFQANLIGEPSKILT